MTDARPPSPADTRSGLDPEPVDALARQLHDMSCLAVWEVRRNTLAVTQTPDAFWHDARHAEVDRGRARFILMGLTHTGWTLTRTTT